MDITNNDKKGWLAVLKKWVLNKYVVVTAVFMFIFAFCGEQSLVNRIHRNQQIKELKAERDSYRQQKEKYEQELEQLNKSTDNREKFAREHYYMHADNEKVFIIEGEK